MRRVLALLLALVFPVLVYAATCTQYATRTTTNAAGDATGYWDTRDLACTKARDVRHEQNVSAGTSGNILVTWNIEQGTGGPWCHVYETNLTTGAVSEPMPRTVFSTRTGDYCPDACAAGTIATRNITIGYAGRDYDANSEVPNGGLDYLPNGSRNTAGTYPVVPAAVCLNTCVWTVGAATGDFYQSRQPTAAGMYRMSADYTLTSTSATCTPTSADNDLVDGTKSAPGTCPGFQGYVNGRPACIPKDGVVSPKALPQDKPHKEGNPKAGSQPTETDRITQTNGDGGNKGGPPHPRDGVTVTPTGTTLAATSTGTPTGTKTAVAGEEQLACGAPGQPPCRIDETGTPNGSGAFTAANTELKAAADSKDAGLASILTPSGKDTSWIMPTWFQPQASCSPWNLGTLPIGGGFAIEVNICPIKPFVEGVLNFLWVLGTFMAVLAMMGNVMGKGTN